MRSWDVWLPHYTVKAVERFKKKKLNKFLDSTFVSGYQPVGLSSVSDSKVLNPLIEAMMDSQEDTYSIYVVFPEEYMFWLICVS